MWKAQNKVAHSQCVNFLKPWGLEYGEVGDLSDGPSKVEIVKAPYRCPKIIQNFKASKNGTS